MARRSGWSNAAYVTVQQAKWAGAEALNVLASPIFHARRLDIFERTGRLPAIYQSPEWAEEGGLISLRARLFSR